MADVVLNPGVGGSTVHTVTRTGKETQVVGLDLTPGGGSETLMNGVMPVSDNGGSLTVDNGGTFAVQADTELTTADLDTGAGTDTRAVVGLALAASGGAVLAGAANPVPVSGTVTASGPLTDTQLRATPVPVSGTVTASGPLTDAQLRASAVPTSLVAGVADNSVGLPATALVVQGYDGTNTQVLATNAAGNLQVGLSAAIPAGANAIGKLAANGGVVIGDVNVVGTVPVSGTVTADTEMPAAAALADGAANPTSPMVGAGGLVYNGATWDRARGDTTSGAWVNVKAMAALPTGANTIGKVDQGTGGASAWKVDGSAVTQPASLASLPALAAGSALAARVNLDPQTANGLSIFHLVSAATTNATNIKASAGQVYGWFIYNSNTLARKVTFHNTAGSPTAGAGVIFTLIIPGSSAANVELTMGLAFATGIAITTTTDLTDAGTTAVALNDLNINIFYK